MQQFTVLLVINTSMLFILAFSLFNLACGINEEKRTSLILSEDTIKKGTDSDAEVVQQDVDVVNDETFVPTRDWQTIKPGQSIPAGLHVRLNLATGEREAKLLDDVDVSKNNEGQYKYWQEGERKGIVNTDHKYFTVNELKSALKEFKAEMDDVKDPKVVSDSAAQSFRSIDELKKDFESLNWNLKSDLDVMKDLLAEFKQSNTSQQRQLLILEDFEYLVHQVDNAQNFADMGGLGIVKSLLNDTRPEFRRLAAHLLGSASQSNPKVQISVVESGLLQDLVRLFPQESDATLLRRYVHALSSIIRGFPYAQKKFLELGGLDILSAVLQQPQQGDKQKVKIITLIFDLLQEREHVENGAERAKQYNEIPLLPSLLEKGWCQIVPGLLDIPDLDSQEKVLKAMDAMLTICQPVFSHAEDRLHSLKREYEQFAKEDSSNDYLGDLVQTVDGLLNHMLIGRKEEL